jgi:hypothetical protein
VEDELKLRLLLGAAIVGSFWFWFHWWKKARLIDDTPRSRIRSAAQGYVEISGRGALSENQPNLAPLTQRPCVWWSYRIERYVSTGRHSSWRTVQSAISPLPFLLRDEEHWCVVNPAGAEVFPSESSVWRGSSEWPATPGGAPGGFFGVQAGSYRYTEHRIYEHERLDIIGEFRSVGGIEGKDREQAVAELLRQWKQDQGALLQRFDADQDKILSQGEWEAARLAARREVDARVHADPPPVYNLLARSADGRPFLIAACDIASIARRLQRKAAVAVVVFLASVTALATRLLG